MSSLAQTVSLFREDTVNDADKYDHEIQLVDHTRPQEEAPDDAPEQPAEPDDDTLASPVSITASLSQKLTHGSIRDELRRRKYAKWSENRVSEENLSSPSRHVGIEEDPSQEGSGADVPQPAISKRDTIRSHRHKVSNLADTVKDSVKSTIRGPRLKHVHTDAEQAFDVLYENQRGLYFLGVPHYSSKSLLNFDPPAWQTATLHPSLVNITNAQLPDPSWVWADGWNNWYVDMSGDVDDEGWRYSFAFGQRTAGRWAWHGTHPFLTSFVRRRRWVRLRIKRTRKAIATEEGHKLNLDYFTIHNAQRAVSPEGGSIATSGNRLNAAASKRWSQFPDGKDLSDDDDLEVKDIASLLNRLRKATIDRERIAAVGSFLDNGGQELFYLAENMQTIVSLFVFQTSRRQLLDLLRRKLKEARDQEGKEAKRKHKERASDGEAQGTNRVDNLQNALKAADEECKRLGMTDVRGVGQKSKDFGQDEDADSVGRSSDEIADGVASPVGKTTIFAHDNMSQSTREVCEDEHDDDQEPQEKEELEHEHGDDNEDNGADTQGRPA